VRSSDDSFDVRWREQTFENGALAGTTRYTAVLSTVLQRPRTEEALRKNPLGIYVHALNWSRDLITGDSQ
jgi:type IV secretion system protein VirB5